MFSLGMVMCAIFNSGRTLIQASNSPSAYTKQLETVSVQCPFDFVRVCVLLGRSSFSVHHTPWHSASNGCSAPAACVVYMCHVPSMEIHFIYTCNKRQTRTRQWMMKKKNNNNGVLLEYCCCFSLRLHPNSIVGKSKAVAPGVKSISNSYRVRNSLDSCDVIILYAHEYISISCDTRKYIDR